MTDRKPEKAHNSAAMAVAQRRMKRRREEEQEVKNKVLGIAEIALLREEENEKQERHRLLKIGERHSYTEVLRVETRDAWNLYTLSQRDDMHKEKNAGLYYFIMSLKNSKDSETTLQFAATVQKTRTDEFFINSIYGVFRDDAPNSNQVDFSIFINSLKLLLLKKFKAFSLTQSISKETFKNEMILSACNGRDFYFPDLIDHVSQPDWKYFDNYLKCKKFVKAEGLYLTFPLDNLVLDTKKVEYKLL